LSDRELALSGALLHAVQLVRRGWMDSAIWQRISERYPAATGDQVWRMVGLAHRGVEAANRINWLNPKAKVNLNLAPQLPPEE
jgi:hypothetical protein